MNTTFTNGRHAYFGKYNSRHQRQKSKICKGLKIDFKKLRKIFDELDNEKRGTS